MTEHPVTSTDVVTAQASLTTYVSVQATGRESRPWRGHIATAVLASENLVLVPDAGREFIDPRRSFEVLILPVEPTHDTPVERIRVAGVEAMGPTRGRRVTGAVLRLSEPSRYPSSMGSFNNCALRTALAATRDHWEALEQAGAVAPGQRAIPRQVLRRVPAIEVAQRATRINVRRTHPGDDMEPIFNICWIVPWCQPSDPT